MGRVRERARVRAPTAVAWRLPLLCFGPPVAELEAHLVRLWVCCRHGCRGLIAIGCSLRSFTGVAL